MREASNNTQAKSEARCLVCGASCLSKQAHTSIRKKKRETANNSYTRIKQKKKKDETTNGRSLQRL